MSRPHDWHDWLGGFPFEVAKPSEIVEFIEPRGFVLEKVKLCGTKLGNNEFTFSRS
jgi:2-polyprenyl-6-hydroxyphenyl methylase/3-demethylubiquinone-9 3-methyltransferase